MECSISFFGDYFLIWIFEFLQKSLSLASIFFLQDFFLPFQLRLDPARASRTQKTCRPLILSCEMGFQRNDMTYGSLRFGLYLTTVVQIDACFSTYIFFSVWVLDCFSLNTLFTLDFKHTFAPVTHLASECVWERKRDRSAKRPFEGNERFIIIAS